MVLLFFSFLGIGPNAHGQIISAGDFTCLPITYVSPRLGKLCDAHRTFKSMYSYVKKETDAMKDGERADDVSFSRLKGVYRDLKKTYKTVSRAEIPMSIELENTPFPSHSELTNSHVKSRFNSYQVAIKYLQAYKKEITKYEEFREALNIYQSDVEVTIQATHELKKSLEEIYANGGAGFPVSSNTLGLTILDLDQKLIPLQNKILRAVKDNIEKVDSFLKLERVRFNNLRSNVKLIINADLAGARKNYLKARKALNDNDLHTQELLAPINQYESYKKSITSYNERVVVFNESKDDRSHLQGEVNDLSSRLSSLRKAIEKLRFRCPNKYTYSNCNHDELKDEYNSKKADLENRYSIVHSALEAKRRELANVLNDEFRTYQTIKVEEKAIDDKYAKMKKQSERLQTQEGVEELEDALNNHFLYQQELKRCERLLGNLERLIDTPILRDK